MQDGLHRGVLEVRRIAILAENPLDQGPHSSSRRCPLPGDVSRSAASPLSLPSDSSPGPSADTWRGLTIAPEHRCAPYDKKRDYPYPQSVERDIVRELGAVYGPYTARRFASTSETDIEHIVAASEAHDSGLCAADVATKARFARDLRNLTLAAPEVNRFEKSGKDAGEWLPARNRCWLLVAVRNRGKMANTRYGG